MLGWGWDGVSIEGLGWDTVSFHPYASISKWKLGCFYFLALGIARSCVFVDPKSVDALIKQSMLIHLLTHILDAPSCVCLVA